LKGRPLLFYAIESFFSASPEYSIKLVLPADHLALWNRLVEQFDFKIPHQSIEGGSSRFFSVQNGLKLVTDGIVAVHDGVRPFVSRETIKRCFSLAEQKGAGVPVVHASDSVRLINEQGSSSLNRANIRLVQTPQCFRADLLKDAYNQPYQESFTDCASVWESFGLPVFLTDGNIENIKITQPIDLLFAEAILK
jgi:2-C-methyl-D-erythritol 4-phosphate cytidylyltransferase